MCECGFERLSVKSCSNKSNMNQWHFSWMCVSVCVCLWSDKNALVAHHNVFIRTPIFAQHWISIQIDMCIKCSRGTRKKNRLQTRVNHTSNSYSTSTSTSNFNYFVSKFLSFVGSITTAIGILLSAHALVLLDFCSCGNPSTDTPLFGHWDRIDRKCYIYLWCMNLTFGQLNMVNKPTETQNEIVQLVRLIFDSDFKL